MFDRYARKVWSKSARVPYNKVFLIFSPDLGLKIVNKEKGQSINFFVDYAIR